ncbi:OPT family oligopeptide transporter [Paludibaculum fermentans]|uniref:Oligopeptide transporter, OPT family n=1 Tax=Paludibaculum fermentans TaxID=1473598 RepID=A0A7S7SHV1_PALFE|nr:oligopeptide transporter, OPT family [Paludibaculum fermentans]QOY85374.1 oligopeptide transporter, OPT family [Paludibaculum fermentans]
MANPHNQHKPFVPPDMKMAEFTLRAVLLGLVMTVILGAANAYLGLRAGQTIAATYPAAVIGMAVLRLFKGSILEENIARTVGSIGESVAAGAIFTIPAFVIVKAWTRFDSFEAYWQSSVLMLVGGTLGILFVTLLRRVMVEDPELPYPESSAAAEIHKAGQRGSDAAATLFQSMGIGGFIYLLGELKLFSASKDFLLHVGEIGKSTVKLGADRILNVGGVSKFSLPAISPAYLGVGYIIGPRLGALNFAGGLLAWGLMVPLLAYFLGPEISKTLPPGSGVEAWDAISNQIWRNIVRPIAVGGMLVGASYTMFKMRKALASGIGRAVADLKKAGGQSEAQDRTQIDLNFRTVFLGLGATFAAMIALYNFFSGSIVAAVVAAVVMIVLGFFFAAVSGNLVGIIGSSNNPISGLTLSTLIIAALMMVAIGVKGITGVAAVLGVAAVVCVSSAVAGEMLQDLKVGHILGGTPRSMQIGDFIGVAVASLVLYFPLLLLHMGNIKEGGIGFGDAKLSAPQAGLMAMLSQGIVGGDMAWPLVVVGICMGLALILLQVKSPMLFSVGMYLPLETTFAIFTGGVIRWLMDQARDKKGFNDAQKARVENASVLIASGLIAGEALMGLVKAGFNIADKPLATLFSFFNDPPTVAGLIVLVLLSLLMIRWPLTKAGDPNEPAPPTAIM